MKPRGRTEISYRLLVLLSHNTSWSRTPGRLSGTGTVSLTRIRDETVCTRHTGTRSGKGRDSDYNVTPGNCVTPDVELLTLSVTSLRSVVLEKNSKEEKVFVVSPSLRPTRPRPVPPYHPSP